MLSDRPGIVVGENIPADLDSEMALLGGMCAGGADVFDDVLAVLDSQEGFYVPAHAKLFAVLRDMFEQGQPIDLLLVSEELRRRGLFEFVGGHEYLVPLSESYGDWTRVRHYAEVVAEKWQRRRLMKVSQDLWNAAISPVTDGAALPSQFAHRLDLIAEHRRSAEVEDVRDVLRRVPDDLHGPRPDFLPMGLVEFEKSIGGLEWPSYVLLAAGPSVGKTAIALHWALAAARAGIDVLFLSLEMRKRMLARRLLSMISGHPIQTLRDKFTAKFVDELAQEAIDSIGPGRIMLTDCADSIRDIETITRSHARKGTKLVFVDYLQLIVTGERHENRNIEVTKISSRLKKLNAHDVTVVALSQLSRESLRANVPPRKQDLRDSGALEQDADQIFALWSNLEDEEKDEADVALITLKNRNGPKPKAILKFNRPIQRFTEE